MHETSVGRVRHERGFTLIDTLVATSIVALVLLAVTSLYGSRPPERRAAALALQGALAETRELAAATADGATAPTGATLTVVPLAGGLGTRIAVYASRPIPGAPPLVHDDGFPPITVPVAIALGPSAVASPQPFTILVASSGYASIAARFAYDPATPLAIATDPGCDETNGVTIAIADGVATDVHSFACRGASLDDGASIATPNPLR